MATPLRDLAAALDRLDACSPHRLMGKKRARLTAMREELLALHQRGHSWRSIAFVLSTPEERISGELVQSVCTGTTRKRSKVAP
jgi:hypothetical protein